MAKLSEREWMVLGRLWESGGATLSELTEGHGADVPDPDGGQGAGKH